MNYYGYNPYNPQTAALVQQLQGAYAPRQEVIKVKGRPGADAYQMGPNCSALLLDEDRPVVYLKTTDGAGYPTVTAYGITPLEEEKPIDAKSLEERIARLEEIIHGQSDPGGTAEIRQHQTAAGAAAV